MMNWFETTPPPNFKSAVEISGCYCLCKDKYLFLKRHPKKPYPATWGVPAGKLEKGETPRECVVREIFEEIGINIDTPALQERQTLYCRIPELDFTYHMYFYPFDQYPKINLCLVEHTEFCWLPYEECLRLPLIVGGGEALTHLHKSQ